MNLFNFWNAWKANYLIELVRSVTRECLFQVREIVFFLARKKIYRMIINNDHALCYIDCVRLSGLQIQTLPAPR